MEPTRLLFLALSLSGFAHGSPLLGKREFSSESAYDKALKTTWNTFWDSDKASWTENDPGCDDSSFAYPSIWYSAIAGRAVSNSQDIDKIKKVTENLLDYKNDDGWFSATTAKDNDVYIDDNAQVLWVFLDSYKYAGNVEHLNVAKKVMDLTRDQWDSEKGGVRWKLDGDYLASISTTEAALSATRLYDITKDESLLKFATDAMDWLFDNLQDPSDKLLYDGLSSSTGEVNHGKLTYSVGVAMSTLAYLGKYDDEKWVKKAIELGQAAIDKKNGFYTNGYWNNELRYLHLLFVGFVDVLTVNGRISSEMDSIYQEFIAELVKEAQFIHDFHQDGQTGFYYDSMYKSSSSIYDRFSKAFSTSKSYAPSKSNFCDGNVHDKPKGFLQDNAAAAQIFYAVSQIS